ncbi:MULTISPECIES: SixA phosphatase family protein [Croceitalea]|uniref:Phosphoglycerate mutase family protein n=1 Tax=Croceitalea vernalis TaxID=3075599 RepID=A0ABU3BK95_9FLAO|nr:MULTISPECIES: phosphoglycerate mutase family protein [unclassified Croceitalea]MDT0540899.1 phosphoglycerate mutase family protein [Croceitalea sp. P059]MDT0622586.1 phosphoglycerate mutase family protein [Croceitalea sp. P007]
MKTITFIRHGKSSWDYQVSDLDRPLKERGINDTKLVAEEFKNSGYTVDFIYSSPANRALHTSMIFTRVLDFELNNFKVRKMLYDFSGESVLKFIKSIEDKYHHILIFGHNYAFTTLVNTLGDTYIENVPTAGLIQIEFDIHNWYALQKGKTIKTILPKELR